MRKAPRTVLAAISLSALVAACGEPAPQDDAALDSPAMQEEIAEAEMQSAPIPGQPTEAEGEAARISDLETHMARLASSMPEITEEDLSARIAILADDEFEGRAPATPGGRAASQWIADEMARIGLEPAFGDSYFSPVPLVEATLDTGASNLTVTGPEGEIPLSYPEDTVYWTKRSGREISFADSELVFAGYGAVAPEYDWNDYAGFDPAGKTVIVLVNDPGFATKDPDLFTGEAMTYYGRWTYKYEEGGRQGADAVIIVHETEPAAYGWDVVRNSWTGPQLSLASDAPKAALEGWIGADSAREIFAAAGLDYDELKAAAAQPGFRPVPLDGVTASADLVTDVTTTESRNVGGVAPGAERPEETIVYLAHWDHLGVDAEAGEGEDAIYNGAQDNATGVAGILEIAEAVASRPDPLPRSMMFLAVTAEESGLLGSDYFAANPPMPLGDFVAAINFDALPTAGPANDMVVIGYGASELEDELGPLVESRGRYLSPDANPQAGYFYRSDHISMAKRGVPSLYAKSGQDLVDGGPDAGAAGEADYRAARYHGVEDEFDPEWDLSGMVQDLEIFHELGVGLAGSDRWPNWYENNEFRPLRDAQMAGDDGDAGGG